ncbi:MAG: hypothetical protein L6R45_10160 [Anaerolineae bacterium]|nr:hypothetical protein [Anaerolineae bacterium]
MLPRWLEYQCNLDDLDDLMGGSDPTVSADYLEWSYFTQEGWADPDTDPEAWALDIIAANPGLWVAELCRIKHDLASTPANIAYCGLCAEYANPRKRRRAARLGPSLPGFESGQYQLHPPCSSQALTWLRKLTYRLERGGFLLRKRERIPDHHQPRGWDWGTRLYPFQEQQK